MDEKLALSPIAEVKKKLGLTMENKEKVLRAVYGLPTSKGLVDGVGEEAAPELILAKYDQLGGYITKNKYKVVNRQFFNAAEYRRKKKVVPVIPEKITLTVLVNGIWMKHIEGEEESLELQLAKKQLREGEKTEEEKKENKAIKIDEERIV